MRICGEDSRRFLEWMLKGLTRMLGHEVDSEVKAKPIRAALRQCSEAAQERRWSFQPVARVCSFANGMDAQVLLPS